MRIGRGESLSKLTEEPELVWDPADVQLHDVTVEPERELALLIGGCGHF